MPGDPIMLRKLWLSSLLLALTGTTIGLAYSETPSNKEIQKPKDRFLTVNEKGKAPVKCKLILAWTNKTGQQCYLVEALETGNKITIVQNDPNSKEKNSTTNYHWVNANTPPANSPIPPEYNFSVAKTLQKELPKVEATTAINNSAVIPMQTAIQKDTKPLKIETATIKKEVAISEVATSSEKPLATEFITIPAPGADKIVVVPEKNKKLFATKTAPTNTDKLIILHEEKSLVATTSAGPEKIISITEIPSKAPLVTKVKDKAIDSSNSSNQITTPATVNSVVTKSESKVAESTGPKEIKKPEFEQPKAQDWRKSWGKMDSSQEKTNITKSQPVEPELPHADRTKPDPLKSVDYLHPKLEEKIAKKAVKAVGRESANQEVEAIVSGGTFPKTTAELAEKSTPKTAPTETIKVTPKEKPKSTPVAKVNASKKIKTETVETTVPLPIIVIKEPRQPRIVLSKKKEPTEAKTPDFLGRTMGRIHGFLDKPKEINANEEKLPPGNGSVIAAGAPPVRLIPYNPNGQPQVAAPSIAHNIIPPQAPQLYPSYSSTNMAGNSYPTQGMANAFTSVPNQRPIPSDVASTVVMQNAFNPGMQKEGNMPAQGFSPQGINPNYAMAQSMASGQMPANMMAYIQPEPTIMPVDTVLMENVVMLKNANQPSQREYAADQLSKIRGASMNLAVQALATAVKEDPAPLVRAACIRSLTRMKINTIEVLEVINEKKTDLDPRVRMEADQAIIQLTSGSSESGNKIRQTGSTFKR
jgi:hypothetical protein